MTPFNRAHDLSTLRTSALVLLMAACGTACSTPGSISPGRFESRDSSGFVITQDVSVSTQVRRDFERAMRLMEDGDNQGAIELLVKVTGAAPEVTTAQLNLGIAYARVGDLEQAEASLLKAIESNDRHPAAYNELGIVYRKSGRFEEARRSYEQALDAFPGFHYARRNLAILCDIYLSDMSCAIKHYEAYSRVVPDDEKAAMWVADLRNRSGK